MSLHTELLFTTVKSNYHICINVGLEDNFSLKTASVAEKALTDMQCGMSLFF